MDANRRHIVCPFEGHPSRPQTLFKSAEDLTLGVCSKTQAGYLIGLRFQSHPIILDNTVHEFTLRFNRFNLHYDT
jgi:hypothetical protein